MKKKNNNTSREVVAQPKPVIQASTDLESAVKQWTAENLGAGGVEELLRSVGPKYMLR